MHELEKMKRAQVQRVDEMSIQKLRENHETVQQVTSLLQQLQEQMNSMGSSGEFQDIESKCCGRLSHVSSQPEMIPFSCFAQPRQKIAAWYMESIRRTGKHFWKSTFYVWFTYRFSSKNFIWQRAKKSRSNTSPIEGESKSDRWRRTKLWQNSNADFCVKTVDCQFYNTGGITAELCGRTAKTANVGITIRQIPCSRIILGVEDLSRNTGSKWFWFSFGSYVMDQRSGDGWFFGRAEILTISIRERIFRIMRCWTRRLLRLWTISSRIPGSKRRLASRNRKPRKRTGSWDGDKSPSWSMTTSEWLVLMTQY